MAKLLQIAFSLTCLLILADEIQGQDQISAQYTVALPTSGLRDYVDVVSFRGFTFDLHRKLPRMALGGGFGWNSFYERKAYATYRDGNASFSGVQDRYNNIIPLYLGGYHLLRPEKNLSPYAGFGVGTIYIMRVTDMGLYRWADDHWSFSLRPEAGLICWLWDNTGLKASVRYHQGFKPASLEQNQSFWSLSVGLVY